MTIKCRGNKLFPGICHQAIVIHRPRQPRSEVECYLFGALQINHFLSDLCAVHLIKSRDLCVGGSCRVFFYKLCINLALRANDFIEMLNKESVVKWFKGLNGDERIDLMCMLLDCCLPWEVRFFGTFLESLAQKDYAALRGPESTANNPSDLSYLYCLEDSETRKRLCLSVALLHSTNRQAAGVLFAILNDSHVQAFGTSVIEEDILTEISLLLTMTANHPAFRFYQKNILRSKLKQLRETRSSCSDLSEECFEVSPKNTLKFYF